MEIKKLFDLKCHGHYIYMYFQWRKGNREFTIPVIITKKIMENVEIFQKFF